MNTLRDGLYIPTKYAKKYKKDFTFFTNDSLYALYEDLPDGMTKFPYGLIEEVSEYIDETNAPPLKDKLTNTIKLRSDQQLCVDELLKKKRGILFSLPGSGKTVMGCELIDKISVKTIVLVPTKYLLDQWVERMQTFLGYTPGVIGDGKFVLKDITISTFASALKRLDTIKNEFGLLLIDETHRIAADTYRTVVGNMNCRYKIGMTGTLERKDEKEFIVYAYLGNNIIENTYKATMEPIIMIYDTGIVLPKVTYTEAVSKLAENEQYNKMILDNILKLYNKRFQLVLTFRRKQIDYLEANLPKDIKVVTGSSTNKEREGLNETITNSRVILATTVLDEGADITKLDTLHLVSPFNNIPKLQQRINRITRTIPNKKQPIIIDYFFHGRCKGWSPLLQQRKRLEFYRKEGYKIMKVH